jgi:hypothetical protein
MVAPYVGGQRVEWDEVERMMAAASPGRVELRNDSGQVLGLVIPPSATVDDDPDWVKAITPEEIERRLAEPGYTFEEVKKRLGWE